MLTIRKRLIYKKGYWLSGLAVMVCASVVTSLNMQTTIRPDRLNAIVPRTRTGKTDDKQQTALTTADEAQPATATRNNQTSSSTNTTQTPTQSTPDTAAPTTPTESPTPTPDPTPAPTPDPTPVPTDPPVTP